MRKAAFFALLTLCLWVTDDASAHQVKLLSTHLLQRDAKTVLHIEMETNLPDSQGNLLWVDFYNEDGHFVGRFPCRPVGGQRGAGNAYLVDLTRLSVGRYKAVLVGKRFPTDLRSQAALRLEYLDPFELPVGGRADVAAVKGQILDESTQRPLSGVTVQVGSATQVTDGQGRFAFTELPPGQYRLEIKEKALQKRQFARTPSITISVSGGEEKWLAVSLTRRSALWASALVSLVNLGRNGSFWGRGEIRGATLAVSARPAHPQETKPRPRILPVQNVQPQVRYYTVQPGDWLSTIAEHFYGDASKYELLLHANKDKVKDPNLIYPGQKLRIPMLETEAQFGPPAASE